MISGYSLATLREHRRKRPSDNFMMFALWMAWILWRLFLRAYSKAKREIGWEPKVHFKDLVRIMVDADMQLLSRETPRKHLGKLP